jgi:Spy/CpxP family protein refolding chaperone
MRTMHSKDTGAARSLRRRIHRKESKMKLQDNLRKKTVVAAAALAIALGAAASLAQPAGAPRGPHGHGAHGDMIGHSIENAKAQLNLNTSQQQMFDAAVANTKAAHQTGLSLHQSAKNALTAELAKAEPDLAAVAAASDNAQAQGQALRKSIRAQWLALYATFSPDQKAVVRDLMQKRMAKGESFRQRMLERFKGGAGTTG